MTLAFFAPLFLGALSLVAIPWLIHHIRRPEREPLRFSSLMFLPKVTKEIIERRRLQHLILMAIRMLLLALLAAAFARPYWRAPIKAGVGGVPARHMILLDASFSMQAAERFKQAKAKALAIADGLAPADKVGVAVFASSPRLVAPLDDALESAPETKPGGKDAAKAAIEAAAVSEESTSYLPALKLAQERLMAEESSPDEEGSGAPLILHLVSDFQRGGLPEKSSGWRLSPRISLDTVDVGQEGLVNESITDLGLRKSGEKDLRLQAKAKNWSDQERPGSEIRLFAGDAEKEKRALAVKPGNATQAAFTLPIEGASRIEGRVELSPDLLPLDDRRYFVWSVPQKKRVMLVTDGRTDQRWPAWGFIEGAFPKADNLPWELEKLDQSALRERIEVEGAVPDAIVAVDIREFKADAAQAIAAYLKRGGRLLLALDAEAKADALNTAFLGELGLKSSGPRRAKDARLGFDRIAWIDFTHPAFAVFNGARYNDFSQIQFFNFHRLDAAREGSATLARFQEDEAGLEPPAMIESKVGEGRAIVWAFGLDLPTTNLCKSIKFVPMLHETLAYLTGLDDERHSWTVGESYTKRPFPRGAEGGVSWRFQAPDGAETLVAGDKLAEWKPQRLAKSGFVRWKIEGADDWAIVDAVNVDPAESSLARIPLEEFEMRVASGLGPKQAAAPDAAALPEGFAVKREFWRILIGLMFAFLLVESWYASRLLR